MKELLDDHLIDKKSTHPQYEKWARLSLIATIFASIAATYMSWQEIESIMWGGPIVSILGVLFYVFAQKMELNKLKYFGLFPLCVSIIWFFIIAMFEIGPAEAKDIVPETLNIATVFVVGIGGYVFSRIRRE